MALNHDCGLFHRRLGGRSIDAPQQFIQVKPDVGTLGGGPLMIRVGHIEDPLGRNE